MTVTATEGITANMRIQLLNGGLGNQLFQYLFLRCGEIACPNENWYFDDSWFFRVKQHNGYELERVFGLKPNLLSNYFDRDVWEEIIRLERAGIGLPQTILNMGLPLTLVADMNDFMPFSGEIIQVKHQAFCPEILHFSNQNVYYHGYWDSKSWFEPYKDSLLSELSFPELTGSKNLRYADMIRGCLSVGVHIRRGDFVKIGWALPVDFYMTSCKKVLDMYSDAHFFVFSDDPAWCRANAEKLGLNLALQTTYVSGNVEGNNYIDMQLLSLCRGLIMSNSSFCYFAALLSKNKQFYINPSSWEL